MKIARQTLDIIATVAFTSHYNVTKKPGWSDAETHLKLNPAALVLWRGIVSGILINADEAARRGFVSFDDAAAAPGLDDLREIAGLPPAPLPGLGGPTLAQGAPARDLSPAGLARRLSAAPRPVSPEGQAALKEAQRQADELASELQPGLAVGRSCDEPEGEHKVVTDAIEQHIRGGDESE